jgi:ankyrin repeat protein
MNRIDRELIEAAHENDLPEVRRLLSVGADVNAKLCDNNGWTTLHKVCWNGNMQVVIELLDHGADIEAKDNDGDTPLHWAVIKGHLPVVKALLAVGADCRAINNYGELPIHYAVRFGNSEVAKYLLQQLYATTRRLPLHKLLKDLTWIGDPYSSDAPPLCTALYQNVLGADDIVAILEYLVDRNPAMLSSRDQDGSLLLHVACRRGVSFAVIQFLVNRYGASVKSVTPQGDLSLFLACEMPDTSLDTIFLLIKHNPMCDVVYDSV